MGTPNRTLSPHLPPDEPRKKVRGRLLVVDDEPFILKSFERVLSAEGHEVVTASNGRYALELCAQAQFDAVISDVRMPGFDGLEFASALRARDFEIPVILVTAEPGLSTAVDALSLGVFRYLSKPVDLALLRSTASTAVAISSLGRLKKEMLQQNGVDTHATSQEERLELRFQSALDQLWMAYQPIVRWSTHEILAYEGLMRTKEASLGNPALLLDAAEHLGRITDVSRLVLSRIVRPFVHDAVDTLIFANIHTSDLNDDFLISPECPLLSVSNRVVFEITERASLDKVADVRGRIRALRAAGYRIALDDIGAGYAGLSSFAILEPDVVKIDMSLVRNVDTEPTKQKLVQTIASLCRDLTQLVVAEGVETRSERDCLVSLGIDHFQGYLFSKPAPAFPKVAWDT